MGEVLPIRILSKRLLFPLYRHHPGEKPDIFIFSTQRSGSTLLFDMIASQPRMKAVGEPFQERKQPVTARYLPQLYSRYVQLDTAMEAGIERYLRDLLDGRFVGGFERSYDRRNPRHHYQTDRNVVKILRANQLIPWFYRTFPGRYIFLLRHPIPVALSRARNGWSAPIDAYIEQSRWFGSLRDEQQRFVGDARTGTLAEQHLAVWCLEHVGLQKARNSGRANGEAPAFDEIVRTIHYEEFVLHPDRFIDTLIDELEIADPRRFREAVDRPSLSSRYSETQTHAAITAGDRESLVTGWVQKVDAGFLSIAREAIQIFDIPWYSADSPYPVNPVNPVE